MILYLDFVVVITFYVQTLLFFLTPQLGSLPDIISDPPTPFIKTPRLLSTGEEFDEFFLSWLNSNYYSRIKIQGGINKRGDGPKS